MCLSAIAAGAEPRIALVVGNGAYRSVSPLDNPESDAILMARSLSETGFDVTLLTDAEHGALIRAIGQFGRDLRAAGEDATGLFYYAGHGVQSFGSNYLVPVDARLTDAADLPLVAIEAQSVLRQMASARNRTNIVILDACRDNPFVTVPDMNDNGLAEMKAPTGTFLAYATAPGRVALDGTGGNSPFTRSLAARISEPGLAIEQLFKEVRVSVLDATAGAQVPWDTSSLTGDFAFVQGLERTPEEVAEDQLWNSVKSTGDPVQVLLFLRGHPGSRYEAEARALLTELMAREAGAAPDPEPEPGPVPAPADPGEAEREMIESARTSGAAEDYEAYLSAYPNGVYSELAAIEMERALRLADDPANQGAGSQAITFTSPIVFGDPHILGRSIQEIFNEASPLHPPLEGLPEELWKNQKCSNCHNWTRERLCEQGHFYIDNPDYDPLAKKHPLGGTYKVNIREWAQAGCL